MFIAIAVQIPTYLIISYLGLIDTFWVHIIPSLAVPVYLFYVCRTQVGFHSLDVR
jgi:ABC-type glycerol-3-phosphate transport system permease component